eukprot:jgi/Botrbrau1/3376/Bobra.0337s0017.1
MQSRLAGFASSTMRSIAQSSSNTREAARLQQVRRVGDLPVKPNKFVEDWGTAREHIELTYKWDWPTLRSIALTVFVFPSIMYYFICQEYHDNDKKYGRKPRSFAFSER